jgi:RNA polymerase sigma factor (sigma-70 family)
LSADRIYPAPPANKRSAEDQARYLSQLTRQIFNLVLSEATIHSLQRYLASAGPENVEDLVGATLLECWEAHHAGTSLTDQEMIRAADRVRQRAIRASKRVSPTDKTETTPSSHLPPEDEVSLVVREFQTVLENSSPEEALIFQRYYLDGQKDIKALAEDLHMSVSTVYRRLNQIRQRFQARRDAIEPPHWAD